jgi:DNA-binding transcriptional MerR regulator
MTVPEIRRLYFTMKEICDTTRVSAHTLKAWERKFPQLRPAKAKSGKRLYRPSDIRTVEQIRDWVSSGLDDLDVARRLETRETEGDEDRTEEFPSPGRNAVNRSLVDRLIEIRKGLEELKELIG